jgi:beta-glucosidase/6-phospho-beta-glucosidase/beta-galactosidase
VPWGFRKLIDYIQRRYEPPAIYVTENGWSMAAATPEQGVCDSERVSFYVNYTSEMQRAIKEDGVRVAGYVGWSLLDNFEWSPGCTQRFGLVYVD